MTTHNICFHGEIRKILCGYPLLSVAMVKMSRPLLMFSQLYYLIQIVDRNSHTE